MAKKKDARWTTKFGNGRGVSHAGGHQNRRLDLTFRTNTPPDCPPGRPAELAYDAIGAVLAETDEMRELNEARSRLAEIREQRRTVQGELRNVRKDLLAPGAAKDLGEFQQQDSVLRSIEAEFVAAVATARSAAASRLREIERETVQRLVHEAAAERDRIAESIEQTISHQLEQLSLAVMTLQRASLPSGNNDPYHSGLLGDSPAVQQQPADELQATA